MRTGTRVWSPKPALPTTLDETARLVEDAAAALSGARAAEVCCIVDMSGDPEYLMVRVEHRNADGHLLVVKRPAGPLMPSDASRPVAAAQATLLLAQQVLAEAARGSEAKMRAESRVSDRAAALGLAVRHLSGDAELDCIILSSPWAPARIAHLAGGTMNPGGAVIEARLPGEVRFDIDMTRTSTTLVMMEAKRFLPFEDLDALEAMRIVLAEGITQDEVDSLRTDRTAR